MRKFYIPTSTLNFNNILSSESISPKAFYEKRQFGYSRWMTIPENPFNNAIVLYDSLCYFERPESEIEDHPMLIEILFDENELQRTESFWYSDHTIYLSPSTTNFYFYSGREMTITKSMSESSLETKLTYLYRFRLKLIQQMPDVVYDTNVLSQEPCVLNEGAIASDIRTNKMKGLLYGYYIGALLSSDTDSVRYLKVLREIHNIFAAILSSFEKRPTHYQNERLDTLFEYLNEQSEDFINVYNIVDKDKHKTKQLLQYFKSKWNVPRNFEDKSSYLFYLQSAKEQEGQNESENYAITWIKSKISRAKHDMKQKRHLQQPSADEIVVSGNNLFSLSNQYLAGDDIAKRFCMALFNETLLQNTNGKISTYKEELATNITLKAKDVYQELWDNSATRAYLNDLRRQVGGEDFKHEWSNGLLPSIAADVIAGDDWEKLLAFMQGKEMTDYKLAFAIYGVLNGFANLTRDFTDLLYEQDSKYVWIVYQTFHKMLFGKELTDKLEFHDFKPEVTPNKIEEQDARQIEDSKTTIPTSVESLSNELVQLFQSHPKYKKEKHENYCKQIVDDNLTNLDEIRNLSTKRDGWVSIVDEIKKQRLQINGSPKKQRFQRIESPTLFQTQPNSQFPLSDSIKYLPLDAQKRIQANWQFTAMGFLYMSDDHINFFVNLCKKEGRGEGKHNDSHFLKGLFDETLARQIYEELKNIQKQK